ncbi:MAG: DUF6691 family protein [Cyclobacteriaceae bacterium]
MKLLAYLLTGIVFGIALTKGEAVTWYRMQEMFHFQGFHMYGIFMTAVPTAALGVWLLRRFGKTADGEAVAFPPKQFSKGTVIGSLLFGFGWALTGACPGPFYAQIGAGLSVTLVTFAFAVLGTWAYGYLQKYLPA